MILLALVLTLYPFIVSMFQVYLLTEIMIFTVFAVSFYLILGQTGLLSFGHAAYFGIGAYITALCLIHLPWCPVLMAVLLGSLSGLMGGLIIGSLLLRLSKIYFALATLAFSQMIWAIAWKWRDLTGGDDGLIGWSSREIAFPLLGDFSLSDVLFLYYLICIISACAILLCWLFTQTPLGNTLASLRSNPERAQFLGVNVYLAKFILFGFSGLIAGLSGSLYTVFEKLVSPKVFDIYTSFDVLIVSVLGGYSNFVGPIIGTLVYIYLGEYISGITARWQLIMGGLFVVIVLYYPNGLVELLGASSAKIDKFFRKRNVLYSRTQRHL